MSYQFSTLRVELEENGILAIKLNRPDKLNALNAQVLKELSELLCTAQQDGDVKGLLVTGEGKAFCAGADINRLAELDAFQGCEFAKQGQQTFNQLENLGKPSVMAINGYTFGGGCELAMAGTLRVAAENAQFGQPEIKLGVIPGYGGTQRLSRLVGKGRALDLCLTGRFIKAEEACQWGLVNRVTSTDQLLAESRELLLSIIQLAPHAVAATINVINQGHDLTLPDALDLEAQQFGLLCATADKQEGVTAFLEKRTPNFKTPRV